MSTIQRVSQLSHRIFNTTANEPNVRRSSNPFANFQKNVLTADVLELSTKKNVSFTGGITQGTKRIYSTFVGSITDFGQRIMDGIESIKEFGKRVKSGAVSAWNKVCDFANSEVHMPEGLKQGYESVKNFLKADVSSIINTRDKEIAKLSKMDPQTQIKPMLSDAVKALEDELTVAA